DIMSREALEDAILSYDGTLMIISHDRYFLNKVINRILELKEDGISQYLGNYSYYIEKKANPLRFQEFEDVQNGKTKTQVKDEKKKKKEIEKEEKASKLKLKKIEDTIASKEAHLLSLQEKLCLEEIYSNPTESERVNKEIVTIESEVASLYEEWENLA
ncbi:MAG: thiamine ABC transporter substrate-binding protein, partial [Clostridium sp.]